MKKEKTYLEDFNKKKCTGCTACKNICPTNAIKMIEDEEGFYYPTADKTKCIDCHLCEKVCPINKKIPQIEPKVYSYTTIKETDLMKASSGGAFGDIVNTFFEDENINVYGCIFDKDNNAIHIGVRNKKDIDLFKKSKYVQSNLLDVFKEIKENLNNGEKVIFSGTPCQISGLKSFLNKEYDNLLLIDIICHGVPSQKLLDLYFEEESKLNNSKVKKINFREKVKEKNGHFNSRYVKLTFENGKSLIKGLKESTYLKGFQNRLFYRPSCYACIFSKINRLSDITIADAWGIEKIDLNADEHKGVSCIIINTKKGKEVFEKMNGSKKKLPIQFVIDNNESYTKPTKLHKNREKFFSKLNSDNFGYLVNKYTKRSIFRRGIDFIKRRLTKI